MSLSVPLFCVVMSFDFAVLALFYSLFHSGFVQDIFYCSLEHVFNVSRTFNVTFLHKCLKQFHYTFTLLLNFTEIVHKSLAALAHISLFSYICLLPLSCMRLMQSSYTDNLMLWYITVQLSYSFFSAFVHMSLTDLYSLAHLSNGFLLRTLCKISPIQLLYSYLK